MRRAPHGPRASDASDVLRLPTSRTTRGLGEKRSPCEALRTFAGTLAIGVGLATGLTLSTPHASLHGVAASERKTATQGTATLDHVETLAPQAAVLGGVDGVPSGGPSAVTRRAFAPRPHASSSTPPSPPPPASSAARGRSEVPHAVWERPLYL